MSIGNICIIGGTGATGIPGEYHSEELSVNVGGSKLALLSLSENYLEPFKCYFLQRHGGGHNTPPHQINHTLHARLMQELEVKSVIGINAVGSLRKDYNPGDIVIPDDLLDFSRSHPVSLFDDDKPWSHTDMSEVFDADLRTALLRAAAIVNITQHPSGVYMQVDGPRFETPAEIKMYHKLGADIIGMTCATEAFRMKEAGIPYAAISVVTNYAAGVSNAVVNHHENVEIMEGMFSTLFQIVLVALHPEL